MIEENQNVVELEFPPLDGPYKKIGILVSGGIDSALVAYLLIKKNKQKNWPYIIVPFTIRRQGVSDEYSKPIVKLINKLLDVDWQLPIIIDPGDLHHSKMVGTAIDIIFYTLDFDLVYTGTNKIPSIKLSGLAPARTKTTRPHMLKNPLENLEKSETIRLFYEYAIEELLIITHSCTQQTVGRCNNCWQCNERAWGFSQLEITDPGNA